MDKRFALALAAVCGAAQAQTPASNPMPDGSRDMFVGLGAQSAPRYDGADRRKLAALPVLQFEFSNGLFIAGASAGLHLSNTPALEYGPLLALQPRRDASGTGGTVGDIGSGGGLSGSNSLAPVSGLVKRNPLSGMGEIGARLTAGGFVNVYLAPQLRLASSVLYGGGAQRDGLQWTIDLQGLAIDLAPHHRLALTGGVTLVNAAYAQSYFGVTLDQAIASGNRVYAAGGGVKDAHVGARWVWSLAPAWMLGTGVVASRLADKAANSPLVERPTNVTVSTSLAYRF